MWLDLTGIIRLRIKQCEKIDMTQDHPNPPAYQADLQPPTALVIHCADPRFQQAYRSFLTGELGISHYVPIVLGGGIHALGAQTFLPKNFKATWQQVKFMLDNFGLKDVVLINHDDCRWYQKLSGFHPKIDALTKGKFDLVSVAKLLLEDFGEIRVRSYWAHLDGDRITFSEVK